MFLDLSNVALANPEHFPTLHMRHPRKRDKGNTSPKGPFKPNFAA
jgi:hypothetical protein